MDAGEGLGKHGLDPQVHWGQGGVLAARALAVVLAAHDDASPGRFGPLAEGRVHSGEDEFADFRDVASKRQDLCAGGQYMVGGDIVPELQ